MNAEPSLQKALANHQAGNLADAERGYRKILAANPHHPDALHMLGLLASAAGQPAAAAELIGRAIAVRPNVPEYHVNLGTVLDPLGRLEEAVAAYRRAIALNPRLAEAHNNLGNALAALKKTEEAIASYRRAAAIKPGYADAWFNLGNALSLAGRFEESIVPYEKAIAGDPKWVAPRNNLGLSLATLRRWEPALAAYAEALKLSPNQAEIHKNVGDACYNQGEMDPAGSAYRRALELSPGLAPAAVGLGIVFLHIGQAAAAIAAFDRALAALPNDPATSSKRIFAMLMHPAFGSREILEETRRWEHRYAAGCVIGGDWTNDRDPDRPLRIGYVSADFRDHVVTRNILPVFRERDPSHYKVFCYSNVGMPDAMTEQMAGLSDGWLNIATLTDDQVAARIREDRIDILVDLSLHGGGNRLQLLARKPAPVQATFAGYPGTTGLGAIDWRITDPYLDPPAQTDADYAERSWRLPDSFWCYDPAAMERDPSEPISSLPAEKNGFVTFGCQNIFVKVNDPVLDLWGRVLQNVQASRMIMMTPPGSARQRVIARFGEFGIAPDRLDFVTYQARPKYLAEFARIDIGLDTFPYNGHTASLDALWSGVPVISRIGNTVVGRAGWSQLSNLRLTELAADSDEDFVKIAVELAANVSRLADLRRGIRQRMLQSPLTDGKRFARNIESAYRNMWREWCETKRADLS